MATPAPFFGEPTDPKGFHRLVRRYLDWMRVMNFCATTLRARTSQLNAFAAWCGARGLTQPRQTTKTIIELYQRHIAGARSNGARVRLSTCAQLGRLSAVRGFFKWLARKRKIRFSPAADIDLPRMEQRLPKNVLSHGQIERILSLPDVTCPLGLRDRAMLETFYSTGLRRSELTAVSLDELFPERGLLIVNQGKGKKDRVVPIGTRALLWIDRYLSKARPLLVGRKKREKLFVSVRGEAISPTAVSIMVRDYLNQAGIRTRGACHMFRHSMATAMLENGADIRYIQEMLGHADLKTTQIYTHVNPHKLREVHATTHPTSMAA